MGTRYGTEVGIVCMPSGRCYGFARNTKAGKPDAFVGPWRLFEEDAKRDLAAWLEDHGYVHPFVHDMAGVE